MTSTSLYLQVADNQQYKKELANLIIIVLAVCLFGVSLGLRNYFQEQLREDLVYKYILGEHLLKDSECINEVKTISDAISSQTAQYFSHGGRVIVHFFVQMFAGPWGYLAYSIFLSILGALVLILFNRYTTTGSLRFNPLIWVLSALSFFYLYQTNWESIAMGMNYLYPMLFTFLILLALRNNDTRYIGNEYVGIILYGILGILGGWSMECFALPLSGGIFLYYALYPSRLKQLNTSNIVLICCLFVGTALLVFAPGNFNRLDSVNPLIIRLILGVEFLYGTILFWLMLGALIVFRIFSKINFKKFIRNNTLDFFILLVSILFGFIANTYPQSFIGVSLFSAIILFKTFNYVSFKPFKSVKSGYLIGVACILLLLCGINQVRLIKYCIIIQGIYQELIKDYIASKDGILLKPNVDLPKDVRFNFSSMFINWELKSIQMVYGSPDKRLVLLNDKDYVAYKDWERFKSSRSTSFGDKFYMGDKFLWFEADSESPSDSIRITYYSIINDSSLIGKLIKIKRKLKNQDINPTITTYSLDNEGILKKKGLIGFPIGDFDILQVGIVSH